ncbi:MAG: N-acetyl-gamma-glutamyl-phosphate reductase [Alphaproteobacteria bacterium]
MTTKVFIDGAAGTTGLEIRDRLAERKDLSLMTLDEAHRKDTAARAAALNDADLVILCLPDDAAREAVALIENPNVRVIDASTAHRTDEEWTYGFAEMEKGHRKKIKKSTRVSNPGCYAQSFVALVRPLVEEGLVGVESPITCNAVSGYSGGGRAMIAEFENLDSDSFSRVVFRSYGLSLEHKHVEEMRVHTGLTYRPLFAPSVGRFYRGMLVEVPLQLWSFPGSVNPSMVEVASREEAEAHKTLDAEALKNTNRMKIYVFCNETRNQARVVAVLDNLGKGAAGSMVQNLNIMTGAKETLGLV